MKNFKAFIITNSDDEYWRGLLRGMIGYVQLHKNWELFLSPYDFLPSATQITKLGMAGIITRPELYPIEKWHNRLTVPIIFFDNYPKGWGRSQRKNVIGKIVANEKAIGQMAFQYLANQGTKNFAYVGFHDRIWSMERKSVFCRLATEHGMNPNVFLCPEKRISKSQCKRLKDWLVSLPKPVCILACNDIFGRFVLASCYNAGLKVPEEVAVLGVDNDTLLCEMSIPSLSSIVLDTEQAGYDAMSYLEHELRRRYTVPKDDDTKTPEPFKRQTIVSVPVRVVARESTRKERFGDACVNTAYEFILNNGHNPIRIDDVVRSVPVSKRLLQIRFKKSTGMSLSEMILKVRLDNIKAYLTETRFSVKQIAQKMQFASPSHLIHFFRKYTGETPAKYRKNQHEER